MSYYLIDHPPAVRQFRERGTKPSGVIVIHTAENTPDWMGDDAGAENVAAWISHREDFGSYHVLSDSDSNVQLVPPWLQAYGDGTGSNPHAFHISAATQASQWGKATRKWRRAVVRNMARAARRYAKWLQRKHGIKIPARRITRAQSDQRVPGFISHAERDPGRRTDPGKGFPWKYFLAQFAKMMTKRTPNWDTIWEVANTVAENTKQPERARDAARRVRTIAARRSTKY